MIYPQITQITQIRKPVARINDKLISLLHNRCNPRNLWINL
jgi:hypothetical protein